jgi:hypothetical protein
MDSGASSHMTVDQGTSSNYFPSLLHNSSHIVVGNGSHLPILGSGHSHIHAPTINFLLAWVLHTPLVCNLIYVHKFTKDNWCSVEFDPFGFSMKDLINKTLLLGSNSSGDLYLFAGSSKSNNYFALPSFTSIMDVWHRRLGHPSSAPLSHLLSTYRIPCNNASPTPSVCEACQKGKHVRLPFTHSHNNSYFAFQIIHCDLWTSPLESISGLSIILLLLRIIPVIF